MRLDRLATLYIASPLLRLMAVQRSSIPILMYHSISADQESGLHPYYRTTTSPSAFLFQMEYLHRNGYQVCSPQDVKTVLKTADHPVTRMVSITFDDGYLDFYREAFPILSRFGFTATVFLPTAYIGESPMQFKGRDCMAWPEIRELHKHGITFGSHTVSHPQLSTLSNEGIEREIVESKNVIEERLGSSVDSFAYPYAFPQTNVEFKRHLRGSLARAGYTNGVCTTLGRAGANSDQFFMERLPVNSLDDQQLFQAKLAGAYDWIAPVQSFAKSAKRFTRKSGNSQKTPIDVPTGTRI